MSLRNTLGGRHKDAVWACFESITTDNIHKQKCIACGTLVSAKAPRLKQHLEKCKVKRDKEDKLINEDEEELNDLEESNKRKRKSESPSCSYILKQPSMSNYIVKTTTAHKEELDKAMAKFFMLAIYLLEFQKTNILKILFKFYDQAMNLQTENNYQVIC